MITDITFFVDGVAAGVVAMVFADARRNHRALDRAEKALAQQRARLDAAHTKVDTVLAKHREPE